MPLRPKLTAVLLVASACGGSGDPEVTVLSDFELTLQPRVIDGQEPFGEAPAVKLVTTLPDGTTEVELLGTASTGGRLEQPSLPPLDIGTRLGLLVERPGGPAASFNPDLLVAYGDITLDTELATGQVVAREILLPLADRLGQIGQLSKARAAYYGSAAVAPGGDVFVFGGVPDLDPNTSCYSRIIRLTDSDGGDWGLEKIDTELKPVNGVSDRCESTATPVVDADGVPQILVTGGRPMFSTNSDCSTWAALFDPVTEEWTFNDNQAMQEARSGHRAVAMSDGRVLIVGGWQGSPIPSAGDATYEIFAPDKEKFVQYDTLPGTGAFGVMAVDIGVQGVLVCGGTQVLAAMNDPQTACYRVDPGGAATSENDLKVPTAFGTLTALPDGKVLLAGGLVNSLPDYQVVDATASAYEWDGASWTEVGSLLFPRSNHTAVPLSDGRVAIVGGVARGGYVYPLPEEPRDCVEIYDPATKKFTQAGCQSAGQGADPLTAILPGEASFILEGSSYEDTREYSGARAYGLIGTGPQL
jgi:hypothetical protein